MGAQNVTALVDIAATEEGTVIGFQSEDGSVERVLLSPDRVVDLLAAILDTDHVGLTLDSPVATVPAKYIRAGTAEEDGRPVIGLVFDNGLQLAFDADPATLRALDQTLQALKVRKTSLVS
jgi:hypothetical protein